MNEHDSERIAGLLEADGLAPPADGDDADVVVLNTCCIRENADNKLYGNLGHLKSVKDANPGMEIVVAGCLAQKDRDLIRERAPHVDVVFGTHNVHRAAELLAPGPRPRARSPRSSRRRSPRTTPSSPRAARQARAARTPRGSPSRSAATTRAPSASCPRCGARRSAARSTTSSPRSTRLAADGVTEVTLLGQNVNSYGRDLTLAAAREAGGRRPGPPAVRRAARRRRRASTGIRRVRYTSPHPKDLRARDDRGHGRPRRRCASTSTCRCSRAATGSWPPCTGATPPSATSSGWPPPGPRRRPRRHHRHHRRLPRRDRRRLRATPSRSPPRPSTTRPTRSSTRPRPGTEAAEPDRRLRRPGRRGRALRAARPGRRAQRARASTRPASAGSRRSWSRARAARTPRSSPAAPARTSWSTSRSARRSGPARYATVEVTGAAPHHLRGELRRGHPPRPPTAPASPSPPADEPTRRLGHAALVGTTATGKSALALALAGADPGWEIVSVDSMQVYRGMDIGTAKPTPAERAEVPAPPPRPRRPVGGRSPSPASRRLARAALADIEARGRRALLVGGTGLYLRAVVDDLDVPGRFPEVRAELEADPDTAGAARPARRARPGRRRPAWSRRNRRRVVRALEVTLGQRPSVLVASGPGLDEHPPTPFRLVGARAGTAPGSTSASRPGTTRRSPPASSTRSARLPTGPHRLSRTAGQALGYRELLPTSPASAPLDEAVDLAVRRTRRFARRQRQWFRPRPPHHAGSTRSTIRDPTSRWTAAAPPAVTAE